jgi:hypothetical protein
VEYALGSHEPILVLRKPGCVLAYARVKCYICHVVRDPQLSKSIRIVVASLVMDSWSSDLHHS